MVNRSVAFIRQRITRLKYQKFQSFPSIHSFVHQLGIKLNSSKFQLVFPREHSFLFLYSDGRSIIEGSEVGPHPSVPCWCCRRFWAINWFFWGSIGFISFQSPCWSAPMCAPVSRSQQLPNEPPKRLLIPSDRAHPHMHTSLQNALFGAAN